MALCQLVEHAASKGQAIGDFPLEGDITTIDAIVYEMYGAPKRPLFDNCPEVVVLASIMGKKTGVKVHKAMSRQG